MPKPERHIFVCTQNKPPHVPQPSCGAGGGGELAQQFFAELDERGLLGRFALTTTGCMGACSVGPVVVVYPDGIMYGGVAAKDVPEIVQEHLIGGKPVERLQVPAEVW
ncbi:MAG: (2Fe-2S) ferredoxin domain-containing protein [Proteobacteria bacterium]|nr:MAG: (2Fe-2S) ferredoxin domain-containing protein [Pseudomonadota bacterium]QKK11533.1 MAG: (2Fe-2S) ferredoxin domain-containing protein [Pseudomonadota bacterium]